MGGMRFQIGFRPGKRCMPSFGNGRNWVSGTQSGVQKHNPFLKRNYNCSTKDCGRQFVVNPQRHRIPPETIVVVDRLLLEKLSLAGIARAVGVSPRWLQSYVNKIYANVPRTVAVHPKKRAIDLGL